MTLRYGLHMLAKNPGFTPGGGAYAGLGLSAPTSGDFQRRHSLLLHPLLIKDSDRLADHLEPLAWGNVEQDWPRRVSLRRQRASQVL